MSVFHKVNETSVIIAGVRYSLQGRHATLNIVRISVGSRTLFVNLVVSNFNSPYQRTREQTLKNAYELLEVDKHSTGRSADKSEMTQQKNSDCA